MTTILLNTTNIINTMFDNTIQIISSKLLSLIQNTKILSLNKTLLNNQIDLALNPIKLLHLEI